MESVISSQPLNTIRAHDTLRQLNYAKRPSFDALWEPKDTISVNVNATEKRRILGDEYMRNIIKTRPRVYMTPGVSLDNLHDGEERKFIADFIYQTTASRTVKDVWNDRRTIAPCSPKKDAKKQPQDPTDETDACRLPVRLRGAARAWDNMQSRSFLVGDTRCDTKDKHSKETQPRVEMDEKTREMERTIGQLIHENELSAVYDKLSRSYGGYRPYVAQGTQLRKRL